MNQPNQGTRYVEKVRSLLATLRGAATTKVVSNTEIYKPSLSHPHPVVVTVERDQSFIVRDFLQEAGIFPGSLIGTKRMPTTPVDEIGLLLPGATPKSRWRFVAVLWLRHWSFIPEGYDWRLAVKGAQNVEPMSSLAELLSAKFGKRIYVSLSDEEENQEYRA